MGKLLKMPNPLNEEESQKISRWLKLADGVLSDEGDTARTDEEEQSDRKRDVNSPPHSNKKVG